MYALITGASSGIGAACAKEFAAKGFDIIFTYNEGEDGAKKTEKEVNEIRKEILGADYDEFKNSAKGFKVDFSDTSNVHAFTKMLLENGMAPEIIINNAGVCIPHQIQDISDEEWDKVMSVNLKSVFAICHDLVPSMIENKKGSIVNIASIWGRTGSSMESSYCASKGAIVMFSKSLAQELGPSGIRVNCVSPGCVDTRMNSGIDEESKKDLCAKTPLERFAQPEEIAKAVAFIALSDASFITGADLLVDGGFLI